MVWARNHAEAARPSAQCDWAGDGRFRSRPDRASVQIPQPRHWDGFSLVEDTLLFMEDDNEGYYGKGGHKDSLNGP